MMFDWWKALFMVCIFGFPMCAISAIIAFTEEHPIVALLLVVGAFLCIAALGVMPEEVYK